jgi:hypothetical protein
LSGVLLLSKKTKTTKKGFWDKVKESAAQQQTTAQKGKTAKHKQVATTQTPSPQIEKTPEEKRENHINGIKKTLVPAIIGTFAGFLSLNLGTGTDLPWLSILLFVIIFSYYAQRLIYPIINVDVKEFGGKDWFYVEFITIDFWLVVWTLLLNPPI